MVFPSSFMAYRERARFSSFLWSQMMPKAGRAKLIVILISCILLVIFVPGVIVLMNRPAIPAATGPNPNGFVTLQRAGGMVAGLPDDYSETEDVETLKSFVEKNSQVGALVDEATNQQFVVPIDYQRGFEQATESITPVRQAMRYLIAKARVAELEEDAAEAARLYAQLFFLSSKTSINGLLVHVQASAAYERLALEKLKELADRLTPEQRNTVLTTVVAANRQPHNLEEIIDREHTLVKVEHGTLRAMSMIWLSGQHSQPVIDRTELIDSEIMVLYNQLKQELAP